VNVASRLESIAPAGGVCVSKSVYDELSNQDDFDGIELGLQSLKGVGRLIEVFGLKGDLLNEPKPSDYQDDKITVHADDEVPSIAIIPFENKGAEEDVFYSYGISVDLISDVTSAGLIRVASKKQIEDVGELPIDEFAKKLDVRYMANGELWRMGDMFQLSVELYDTKDKKVVWSDRWQEKWDNLPTIKGSLSDGLLKALDTKSKLEQKIDTTNPEAYEFYLKAKHKYEKRENTDDTEITRGLLQKAIELDDNLILAKLLLGTTYREMGDYDEVMKIIALALKQVEEVGDKSLESSVLNNLAACHVDLGDYDKGLDCFNRALTIEEEPGDKRGVGTIYHNIGCIYDLKGNRHKALENFKFNHEICKDYDDKRGMAVGYNNIGNIYYSAGDYDIAHNPCIFHG
jgi:TolB-like protein